MYKKFKLLLVLFSVAFIAFSFKTDLFQVSKNLDIFASVYKELNLNYVDEVNSAKLIRTSIDAMLNDLDPYTEFVPESEIEDYRMKYVSTQYGGIGAAVIHRDGRVFISDPFEGYPAQKADLKAGDEIIAINDQILKGKNNEQVSLLLKGPKETPVKLKLARDGKILEKEIKRADIKQPNVSYYGMIGNTAYIRLDKFLENSAQEVKDALVELKKNNPTGLIIDLRNNGGGILQEAVKIVNLFVGKDIEVVSQKGKNPEKNINYKTFLSAIEPDLPLAILINNRSASASEIVAGSLQDLDRAVIIGQRSFGKGLVQQTFNLPYNTLVKVTVAKYYTSSGRCIQALDYTHRTEDGVVEKVSDSLINEYKTKGGRLVYDGSGIYPDIHIEPYKFHQITQTLVSKYHVFDFGNEFVKNNPSIATASDFKLSETDYNTFLTFIKDKNITYKTSSERVLANLKEEVQKEKKLNEVKAEIEALQNTLSNSKKVDLITHKAEIMRVLESEIVQRYYYEKGRIVQTFQYDEEIKKAKEFFNDKQKYNAVLAGMGNYKTIGKPVKVVAKAD
ncbi:PDZ domain-containing protein [Pedobacter aquae]|uniref:PDZ domain-containing protein n=1 Tax=Pedobacter aquae TaxID=2605747 RepID=A0A5C0VKI8_9SPHI|nr:S41 family peptidase [Pedobacter aquae]QEK52372.1 PDZ domain-containing protein [Pedobacter aquae]